jgi:hypothetical protein
MKYLAIAWAMLLVPLGDAFVENAPLLLEAGEGAKLAGRIGLMGLGMFILYMLAEERQEAKAARKAA